MKAQLASKEDRKFVYPPLWSKMDEVAHELLKEIGQADRQAGALAARQRLLPWNRHLVEKRGTNPGLLPKSQSWTGVTSNRWATHSPTTEYCNQDVRSVIIMSDTAVDWCDWPFQINELWHQDPRDISVSVANEWSRALYHVNYSRTASRKIDIISHDFPVLKFVNKFTSLKTLPVAPFIPLL